MVLSEENRWRIVFYKRDPLGPKFSNREIAKKVKCTKRTAAETLKRYQATGSIQNLP